MANILIIDDEKEVGTFLAYLLQERGHKVTVGYSGADFERLCEGRAYQLAMIDVKLPDTNGLDILQKLGDKMPACKTVIMTGYSTVKTAVEAIRLGASDYVEKPFADIEEIEQMIDHLLNNQVTTTENDILELAQMSGIIFGEEAILRRLLTLSYKIASKNINVLIQGETGTGKELLAHFIHLASNRSEQPYIRINCGALAETMLESELFGHEKGAFTSAVKERRGVFEIANKGTLFLDEIGEASAATQVKLLRVLETGEYMRVGGEEVRKTNIRIISATNVDLREEVKMKRFREDLLYRLDVVTLQMPPLRERKRDIMTIAHHMIRKADVPITFHEDTVELLQTYEWPGNVRELSNVMKRALTILDEGETVITPAYLPEQLTSTHIEHEGAGSRIGEVDNEAADVRYYSKQSRSGQSFTEYTEAWQKKVNAIWEQDAISPLEDVLEKVQALERFIGRAYIEKTLQHTMGNRKEAAALLNVTDRRLRYLLKEKGQQ